MDLAGIGRLQALPEPELQRAQAHQHRVRRCAEAVLCTVPGVMPRSSHVSISTYRAGVLLVVRS